MEILQKQLILSPTDYFAVHLAIVNSLLPKAKKMTNKEMEVLANFISLEGEITNYRFGTSGRKIVMKNLNLSPAGMSNYIGHLIDKGALIEQGDIINIWPVLMPEPIVQKYMIQIVNNKYINQNK